MLLDLDDERLRARVSRLPGGKTRLVVDYPTADLRYRDAVFGALSDLLRPPGNAAPSKRTDEDEAHR